MSSYGLKTNIALNISILLFFGMMLTVILLTSLFQQFIIKTEIEKGLYAVSVVEELIAASDPADSNASSGFGFRRVLFDSGVSNAVMIYPGSGIKFEFGKSALEPHALEDYADKAFVLEKREVSMEGEGWGVFWKHKRELVIASPIYKKKQKVAGLCLVIPLKKMFLDFRKLLKIMFVYIIINVAFLTLAGLYQISKSAVKPIHRLLKRANEYHDENTPVIFEEKTGNEFKKLSGALNTMLGRISDDRKKLHETVKSLEIANEELKNAQRDIVRAEKLASVGRLSSGIAHEIGNPLGIVSGYLELIKDENQPFEEKKEFIVRAEKELQRIDGIIRQLLDYSRTSREKTSSVSVHEVIDDVVDMVKIQPFMDDIKIDDDGVEKELFVRADFDQLKQVLLNLLINAADAINAVENQQNGRIKICAEKREKDFVVISLTDNGAGITEKDIGNVFDPFFTTKEPGKGTGLGLSVCFMIIEGFDGKITIESKDGEGAEINIELQADKGKQ